MYLPGMPGIWPGKKFCTFSPCFPLHFFCSQFFTWWSVLRSSADSSPCQSCPSPTSRAVLCTKKRILNLKGWHYCLKTSFTCWLPACVKCFVLLITKAICFSRVAKPFSPLSRWKDVHWWSNGAVLVLTPRISQPGKKNLSQSSMAHTLTTATLILTPFSPNQVISQFLPSSYYWTDTKWGELGLHMFPLQPDTMSFWIAATSGAAKRTWWKVLVAFICKNELTAVHGWDSCRAMNQWIELHSREISPVVRRS